MKMVKGGIHFRKGAAQKTKEYTLQVTSRGLPKRRKNIPYKPRVGDYPKDERIYPTSHE